MTKIRNNNDQDLYSLGNDHTAMDGQGHVRAYSLGNGKSSTISYENLMPKRFYTDGIQDLTLDWDFAKGNLSGRVDARKGKTETFGYDNLDRLTSATISGQTAQTVNYAGNGNISSKTDAGNYGYHPTKLNAVTGVSNAATVIPSQQQDIVYNAFQQPYQVKEGQYELTYTYGADYNRIKSELKQNGPSTGSGTVVKTRYYFSNFEKDNTGRYVHYVSSPVGLIAIVENNVTHYTYTDHLGSILAVTNSGGGIEAEQNFDAWGRRRDKDSWALLAPTAATGLPVWLYRGYTGHEHIDQFGLGAPDLLI